MPDPLACLFLLLLHALYALSLASRRWLLCPLARLVHRLRRRRAGHDAPKTEEELLRSHRRGPRKKPKHVALVLDPLPRRPWPWMPRAWRDARTWREKEERTLVEDVRHAARWCVLAGIERLSVYDSEGILKKHAASIIADPCDRVAAPAGGGDNGNDCDKDLADDEVQAASFDVRIMGVTPLASDEKSSPTTQCITAQWNSSIPEGLRRRLGIAGSGVDDELGHNHGPNPAPTLRIAVLSSLDGQAYLAQVATSLAEGAARGALRVEDVDLQLVDEKVSVSSIPEPDLLIVHSPGTLKLHGFPPWHVRLSEIYHDATSKPLKLSAFLEALDAYAGCQMRFGR